METGQRVQDEFTPAQRLLRDVWEKHVGSEFASKDPATALATMVPDAHVNHVPVLTGGSGREQLTEFYTKHFIPHMPPDMEVQPIFRTIGSDCLVDEMIIRFTHSIEIEWMLPGIAPTGKRVEIATVAIVHFRDGKVASEHIY